MRKLVIPGAPGRAELVVAGTSFHSGDLEASIDGEWLRAMISPAGAASGVMLSDAPGAMVRVAK